MIGAISFDTILRILVGRRSGPDAFEGFKLLSSLSMPGTVNNMSGIDEARFSSISRKSSSGSLVNCGVYCMFRASAFTLESLMVTLSGLRTGMLLSPAFFCLI